MDEVIVLDASPLGLLCHPKDLPTAVTAKQWAESLLAAERRIIIPEISDYEVRRELIRAKKTNSIHLLNGLQMHVEYLPLTTQTMLLAAELWAKVRQSGKPTSDYHALDGDVILAAQTINLGVPAIVATNNIDHIRRFVSAELWQKISP